MPRRTRARPRALFVQYANPAAYPPVVHATHILADHGWEVVCLGTGGAGADDALRMPHHPRINVARIPYRSPGIRQKAQYASFTLAAIAIAAYWTPDWMYASDPLACIPALLASVSIGARVVYHEHDSPDPDVQGAFMRLALWARSRLACRSEICVLPNPERAKIFRAVVPRQRPIVCVPNYPRLAEIPNVVRKRSEEGLRVYYHGTLVPQRVPLTLVAALSLLPEVVRVRLVGYESIGHPNFSREIMQEATRLRVESRIEIMPARSRHDLLRFGIDHDIGVALMPYDSDDINMRHMVGASNKATDYLATGLALLVTDLPDWRATYVDPGYGLSCDPRSASSIAQALEWFMTHADETTQMGERGRQRLRSEWNYDRVFEPVLEAMSGGKVSNI